MSRSPVSIQMVSPGHFRALSLARSKAGSPRGLRQQADWPPPAWLWRRQRFPAPSQWKGWAPGWDFQNLREDVVAPVWLSSGITLALPGPSPSSATTSSVTLGNRSKLSQTDFLIWVRRVTVPPAQGLGSSSKDTESGPGSTWPTEIIRATLTGVR